MFLNKIKLVGLVILWLMSSVCLWYNLENKHEVELQEQAQQLTEVSNKKINKLVKEIETYEKTIGNLRSDLNRMHELNNRISSSGVDKPLLKRCAGAVTRSSETITRQQELIGKYHRNLKALSDTK